MTEYSEEPNFVARSCLEVLAQCLGHLANENYIAYSMVIFPIHVGKTLKNIHEIPTLRGDLRFKKPPACMIFFPGSIVHINTVNFHSR